MSNRDGKNAHRGKRTDGPCWQCDSDPSCPHTKAANQRRMQTTIAESLVTAENHGKDEQDG